MSIIKRIEIGGFRGQSRVIRMDLQEDANFLIGRNGTGKTTLINIIHAALAVKVSLLRDAPFSYIEFLFKRRDSKSNPRIRVEKQLDEDSGYTVRYSVYQNSKSKPEEFVVSTSRARAGLMTWTTISGKSIRPPPDSRVVALQERLSEIFRTSWLSIQRRAELTDNDQEEFHDRRSDVDKKLDQASNDLVRYFSRLDRQVVESTQFFQKNWFLSFLATGSSFKTSAFNKINLNEERSALTTIFDRFSMTKESYSDRLEKHLNLAQSLKDKIGQNETITFRDFLIAFDVTRLHSLVEQWEELQEKQTSIYKPKADFIEITSQMLYKKTTFVNKSNQICVTSDRNHPIPINSLSSGEKQLLIFLSETLLQEQESYVFLADEPELSLHVEWQEELVPNILKINRNAQILFATHSPDIVNIYQNNVIRMEDLVA